MGLQEYNKWDGVTNHRNCIYAYQNKKNGKIYVGQTEQMKVRHGHHRNGKDPYSKIDRAFLKYGENGFDTYILESELPDHDAMNEKEIYYIALFDSFKNGYNSTLGGGGTLGHPGYWRGKKIPAHVSALLDRTGKEPWNKGMKMPEEIVAKQRGRVVTDEQRRKISRSLLGHTPWNLGIPMSDEQKAKLSASKFGKPSKKKVAVVKVDIEGNVIAKYDGAKKAALSEKVHIHYGEYNPIKNCYYFRENEFTDEIAKDLAGNLELQMFRLETEREAHIREIEKLQAELGEIETKLERMKKNTPRTPHPGVRRKVCEIGGREQGIETIKCELIWKIRLKMLPRNI